MAQDLLQETIGEGACGVVLGVGRAIIFLICGACLIVFLRAETSIVGKAVCATTLLSDIDAMTVEVRIELARPKDIIQSFKILVKNF